MIKAYIFPGQGSQIKGMGGDLFDKYKHMTEAADDILGYSIKRLCLEDPDNILNQTRYTQPALYVVNALSYVDRINKDDRLPDVVAGHSLGEYNAVMAGSGFDYETGLKLVKKRAELMAQAKNGGMAAILGATYTEIRDLFDKNSIHNVDFANFNTPRQIVVSGLKNDIADIAGIFTGTDIGFVPLNTSGAFHSRYMKQAEMEFADYVNGFTFQTLKIPVMSNVTGLPYATGELPKNLIEQISGSVKWSDAMQYIMALDEAEFSEIGNGEILTRMLDKIRNESSPRKLSAEERDLFSLPAEEDKHHPKPDDDANLAAVEDSKQNVTSARESTDKNDNRVAYIQNIDRKVDSGPNERSPGTKLGDSAFKKDHGLQFAYVAGGLGHGISSVEMVTKMAKAGFLAHLGTYGLNNDDIRQAVRALKDQLKSNHTFGVNVTYGWQENNIINILLEENAPLIEASRYLKITHALVLYRLKGIAKNANGEPVINNRIMAKISRPEIAEKFLSPPPDKIVADLLQKQLIDTDAAELAASVPMADDICVEADSGWYTDQGNMANLLPTISRLRDEYQNKFSYRNQIRVGGGGGLGSPESMASAFILGADFLLTGSINQCTQESAASPLVKDMLQEVNIQDTEYVPAYDMFELGEKSQVLKKGVFFPARANKLYSLYKNYKSIDEIDRETLQQIEKSIFGKPLNDMYEQIKAGLGVDEVERAERNPKHKMALIFKKYLTDGSDYALRGVTDQKINFQIPCGPAMGAFNQWARGSDLENWRNRHVDEIAIKLMDETWKILESRYASLWAVSE